MSGSFTSELITRGGIVFIILIICNVLSVAVIIQKFVILHFFRKKFFSEMLEKLSNLFSKENISISEINSFCERNSKFPAILLVKEIINNHGKPREEIVNNTVYWNVEKIIVSMEEYLGILATLGSISPFIGLFGTVLGIINAFKGLAITENIANSMVAEGIAEALINTAGGLFVAIFAVVFYNYFMRRIKKTTFQLEDFSVQFIDMIKNKKIKAVKHETI